LFLIPRIEILFQTWDKILKTKAIGVMHFGFFMKTTIWIKIREGLDGQQWTIAQT
jgi:hypothetical protein